MQPFLKPEQACEGGVLLRWWRSGGGPDALQRAAAETLHHRRPVAETRLGGGRPAEATKERCERSKWTNGLFQWSVSLDPVTVFIICYSKEWKSATYIATKSSQPLLN